MPTLALPTLPFDKFLSYYPSWQETGAVVAYGVVFDCRRCETHAKLNRETSGPPS